MAGTLPRPWLYAAAGVPSTVGPHHGGARCWPTYQDLLRATPRPLPPVLPIVHHGPGRWTATVDVAGLAAPCGAFLAPYQPAQRYFLLDIGGYTDVALPQGRNLMAALIRLERSRGPADVDAVLGALDEWLSESGNEGVAAGRGRVDAAGMRAGSVRGGDMAG